MSKGKHIFRLVEELMKDRASFHQNLNKVKLLTCENGRCTVEFTVDESMQNNHGTMHGGFTALLADSISTFALMSHPNATSPGISLDLHTSYLKGAKIGTEVVVDATTIRAGKKIAFLEVSLKEKHSGDIIAKGIHTKYVADPNRQ